MEKWLYVMIIKKIRPFNLLRVRSNLFSKFSRSISF